MLAPLLKTANSVQAQNMWKIDNIVGLCKGTRIFNAPGGPTFHTTVPEDNWAVKVINGPANVGGVLWWDTSRKAAGDPSGGTGWVSQNEADSCFVQPTTTPLPPTSTPLPTASNAPMPTNTPVPTPTSSSPNLCVLRVGVDSYPFIPFSDLSLVTEYPLFTVRKTFKVSVKGAVCPAAIVTQDQDAEPDEIAIAVRSPNGETRFAMNRKGEIKQVGASVSVTPYNKSDIYTRILPPTLGYEATHENNLYQEAVFRLAHEQQFQAEGILKPPPKALLYVVAVGGAVVAICVLTEGSCAVFAPAVRALLAPAAVPLNVSESIHSKTVMKQQASTAQPEVLDAVRAVYGGAFVNFSTINTLSIDSPTLQNASDLAGQTIAFEGSNFTPNGRIAISLSLPGHATLTIDQELRADENGNIRGEINLSPYVTSGRWLLTAIDTDAMYLQLKQFGDGETTNLHYYLAAATVDVAGSNGVFLPLVIK